MGLFKHLFWLAPVLMGIFYYISMAQNTADVKMQKDELEFDRDFAMHKAGTTSEDWLKIAKDKEQRLKEMESRVQVAQDKQDDALERLENAQNEHNFMEK